jgi:hypothetical protein
MRKFLWPVMLLLAGCAIPPREVAPPAAPPEKPAVPGEPWTVTSSQLDVRVYRDGPMQKLGHNHVITTAALTGTIQMREPVAASSFELSLPLESLVVDDDAARARAGADFPRPCRRRTGKARAATCWATSPERGAAARAAARFRIHFRRGGQYEAKVRVSIAGERARRHRAVTPS